MPPVGKVKDFHTGRLVSRPILRRSDKEEEQYWERISLPKGWKRKRIVERAKQVFDLSYVDVELETFRRRERSEEHTSELQSH